jgi:hypothetical protein
MQTTNLIALLIKRMSRKEKLMALETLWEDLSRSEAEFKSPSWNQEEFAETIDSKHSW